MSPLKTGDYLIQNLGQDLYIGRNLAENFSPLPKEALSLPKDWEAEKWHIEALPNGAYNFYIRGDPTGIIRNQLWAIIDRELGDKPNEWIIKSNETLDTYFIGTQDNKLWSLPTKEPLTQIAIGLDGAEEKSLLWRITGPLPGDN